MQAKQEYLASRILLKQLAKHTQPQYAHIPLNKMSTHFNEECSKLQLHINHTVINTCISHSHGLVGVALNVTKAEFGFDIEKINLKRPFEKLAKHFYHKAEIALITAPLAIKEQAHRFFRIWTLKEALAKATSRPIAQLLSPNVFDEFSLLNLTASSNSITVANEEFDISVAHKKSTDWRCFILNNLDT
jgi:4'-phosphopantetheinyl transferase